MGRAPDGEWDEPCEPPLSGATSARKWKETQDEAQSPRTHGALARQFSGAMGGLRWDV
jgi:hypothetical protein